MMPSMRTTDPIHAAIRAAALRTHAQRAAPGLPAVRAKLAPGGTIRIPMLDPIYGCPLVDDPPPRRDDRPYGFQRGPWACR
jgi:hypothetical protein